MITSYRLGDRPKSMAEDKENTGQINGKASFSVHFWWVICVMTAIIIILAALLCTEIVVIDRRVMTFLSFTATILSIVLSVFAIMYSYYSLQESSRQWGDIKKAVSTIDTSTQMISQSTQLLLGQVANMNKDIGALQSKIGNEIPSTTADESKTSVNYSRRTFADSLKPKSRVFSRIVDE